jgi:hypothetical protein
MRGAQKNMCVAKSELHAVIHTQCFLKRFWKQRSFLERQRSFLERQRSLLESYYIPYEVSELFAFGSEQFAFGSETFAFECEQLAFGNGRDTCTACSRLKHFRNRFGRKLSFLERQRSFLESYYIPYEVSELFAFESEQFAFGSETFAFESEYLAFDRGVLSALSQFQHVTRS